MLNVNDIIKINKININDNELFLLSQLYLPLMGVNSYSIYLLLNSIKENETTVKRLLDILGFDKVNTFDQALARLEGLGLIKRYYSENKGYLIDCAMPMSVKQFLNEPILKKFLIAQIGDVEVHNLLKTKKITGYENISVSFDEVFKSISNGKHRVENIEDALDNNIIIKNSNFDYIIFKLSFEKNHELPDDVLNDPDFERHILQISYELSLDESQMFEACKNCISMKKDPSYENINKCAQYIYQHKKANTVLGFEIKNVEKYEHTEKSVNEEMLRILENSTIEQILASISGGKASGVDIRTYTEIKNNTGLPEGVINALILYIYNNKKGENVDYNYIEKVIRNWMKDGVKTTRDVLVKLSEKNTPTISKNKNYNKGYTAPEPEWVNNKKEAEQKELTDEEKKEAEELVKKLFGN